MNKELLQYALDHPETLPHQAYTRLPSDKKQVIIVVKDEKGYYPYQKYPTAEMAKETCEYANEKIGATEEQAEALMILSMRT